jgi:hypothetical protein
MNPQQLRTAINRANAQHSTGPKTEAGKQRSSLNALRHGLTGQTVVMPSDDLQAYQHHLKSYIDEYNPQGRTEADLVQALADTSWRLNRVAALETNVLTLAVTHETDPALAALALAASLESQTKALANLSMHTQRLSRQFEKTLLLLRDLQKTRRYEEQQQLNDLLDIMEMYEAKGETYNPTEDGFVFSESQIKSAIQARNRENRAAEADEYNSEAA